MAKPFKSPKGNTARLQTKPAKESIISVTVFNFNKWFPYIIAAFGLLLYINTLTHSYVLDDDTVIAKNSIVTKGIKAIPEILTTSYSKGGMNVEENMYRPLSLIMFALEWQVLPNNPFFGHLMNVLLYALSGFFFYKLLRKWFSDKPVFIAFSIAILFIVHPLHTEVVANIKSRDEILAFLFSILALNSFFNYTSETYTNKLKHLVFGNLFFFLALLSKENAITLYVIIPLASYFFSKKTTTVKYASIIGSLTVLIIFYFILREIAIGYVIQHTNTKIDVFHNSLAGIDNRFARICNAFVMLGYYIRLFIFPYQLSYDYSLNTFPAYSIFSVAFISTFVVLTALASYVILNIKKNDSIAFGIIFFFIAISVTANIFFLVGANFAERFIYLPSAGLCIAVILLLERLTKFRSKNNIQLSQVIINNKLFSFILLIIVVLFSAKTFSRNFDWKDNLTLFSADKDHNPQSFRTLKNYADALYNKIILLPNENDPQRISYMREARENLDKSIAITDQNFESWNSMGKLLTESNDSKDFETAENALTKASILNNQNAETWFTLGKLNFKTAKPEQAISSFKKALNAHPDLFILTNSQIGIGESYMALKKFDNAITELEKAIKSDNSNPSCYYSLGSCYAQNAQFQKAIEIFNKIENLNVTPTVRSSVYNNTGMCYLNLKEYKEALVYFQKALEFNSVNKAAISNISITYSNLGNTEKAMEYNTKLQSIP